MKVAALAAQRGHDVALIERADEHGGHLNQVCRLPGRETRTRGVAYLERTAP
jgi:NADPH-dependent 2,4-dienoyl-CoA reductase/sulfur reductase-like enzyme